MIFEVTELHIVVKQIALSNDYDGHSEIASRHRTGGHRGPFIPICFVIYLFLNCFVWRKKLHITIFYFILFEFHFCRFLSFFYLLLFVLCFDFFTIDLVFYFFFVSIYLALCYQNFQYSYNICNFF